MNGQRIAVWLVLLISSVLNAQTPALNSKTEKIPSTAPAKEDPELRQRRSVALSALQSLAIEARSYRDEPLRARVQARVADAIWERDQDAARALFRRAKSIDDDFGRTRDV